MVIPINFESPLTDDEEYVKYTMGQRNRQMTPHHPNARKPRTMLESNTVGPSKNESQTIIFSKYGASPVSSSILDIGIYV
jgi:hypothetical protein